VVGFASLAESNWHADPSGMSHRRQQEHESLRVGYADAAIYIGIPVGTLRSLIGRKILPHIRLGPRVVRFDLVAIDRWLAAHTVE